MRKFLERLLGKTKPNLKTEADLYNAVGSAVIEAIGDIDCTALLYAEMEEDKASHFIRFSDDDSQHFRGTFAGESLTEALFDLRGFLTGQGPGKMWETMEYLVDKGEVSVSLSYTKIDEDIAIWERSEAICEKYFPGKSSLKE